MVPLRYVRVFLGGCLFVGACASVAAVYSFYRAWVG